MTTLQQDRTTNPRRQPPHRMFKPPEWHWTDAGEVGWWCRGPWRDTLLGPDGLRLEQWRAEGRLSTVKSGPHRVVYRVDLPEGPIFIKHYLVPDYRAMFRQWFRRGKGRNEGKRSELLRSIGVPTIYPIALGERRKRKFLFENYLVTWEIPGSLALDEFLEGHLHELPEPGRSRVRQRIARELGVLTARLHNHGLTHIDFHPGNVLIRLEGGDRVELSMIDLDALRQSKRLTWKQAQRNLALLDHYFWVRSSRVERHRFVRAYLEAREGETPDPRRFARGIEEMTRAWAERLWRRWGRRCRSTNKYFRVHPGRGTWAVAAQDVEPAQVEALLADPDAPFRGEGAAILKDSRTTTVAEANMSVAGEPTRVVYKRFNRKKWIDPWLNLFRPSRAWRSWQAGQDLCSRGIPTPRNLLFVSRKRRFLTHPFSWFLPHETYLATIKEDGVQPLSRYIRTVLPALPPEDRRRRVRRLNDELARLIRDLHDRSLSHRDLKASNILIRLDPSGHGELLSLIDLVGVRLITPVPRGRRVQNLARLSLSLAHAPGRTRTETLRFLRAYLPWGLSPLSDWKGLWRDVQAAISAKQERNHRRGRPLS
ncbi:Lipopolysaccharide core heptose(I) kinase RfaP [Aquisphaera giovannonii]|uniref:Lipopolysaccharide core heptose(I) kinase RfaP n=1 Tax=Aquisphaera giovannonii TaxID=406548 RepID=A0A5B9WBQ1_9BACT|nr:lipopolysaccharide kinase InaA family protein [Aquisphaera giovannonii]QEH37903.1 Lipopolysaccharide core heptose(I) kinase RfaP [Aquisphaera giovannonii]